MVTRLQSESDFAGKKKKRVVLWEKVLREIKTLDPDFPFSRDEIMRKYLNFMVTYKRIKKRNCTSGESATSWEFFDKMDEVYGTRTDVTVPENMLDSSLEWLLSDSPATPDTPTSPQEPPRKRARCDVIEFLQNESVVDKEIMNEFLKVEKEKLSVEKDKVEEIRKLREVICEMLNQNSV